MNTNEKFLQTLRIYECQRKIHLMVFVGRVILVEVVVPTKSSQANGKSYVKEVRPDHSGFEDRVGLLVKPIWVSVMSK